MAEGGGQPSAPESLQLKHSKWGFGMGLCFLKDFREKSFPSFWQLKKNKPQIKKPQVQSKEQQQCSLFPHVTLNTAFAITDPSNDTLSAVCVLQIGLNPLEPVAVTAASTWDHGKEASCNV